MIDLNFELTKSELVEAQRRLTPIVRVLTIVSVVVGLFLLWLTYYSLSHDAALATRQRSKSINIADLIAATFPFVFFVAIYLPLWLNLRNRLRKQRENPLLTGPRRMMVDDAGIRSVHALAETFYRWEAIEKVFVTKQLYLLRAWSIALIIPKRVIPPDQVEQFERLVRNRVMERTGGFPVRATPPPLPASNV
jgi:hypothetical protein